MNNQVIKSPIFYMGNKERLIKKGLIDLFPKNINKFIDCFCGSCVVSMNVNANYYILNDNNKTIIDLLEYFKNNNAEDIIESMQNTIKNHNLLKGFNKRSNKETEQYKQLAKTNYNKFRDYYNNEDNSCKFFSQSNVHLFNTDYTTLNFDSLCEQDFVYFDPPYTNTLAIYNEQQGWSINDDYKLFNICNDLNNNGIRWAISNVFKNKGIINQHIIDWVNKNNYNVYHFNDFTYVSCGKGNANTDEVLITNY